MQVCVERGCATSGVLPGSCKIKRRAMGLHISLQASSAAAAQDPLQVMDWGNLFPLAVNEKNAAVGRVVTVPTNGAAGIIPSALDYYVRVTPAASNSGAVNFLLTAAANWFAIRKMHPSRGPKSAARGKWA